MLKIIDDMESVGDAIYQLSKVIDNSLQRNSKFTREQMEALSDMFSLVNRAFLEMNNNLKKGFNDIDVENAFAIEAEINEKRDFLRQQHVEDLKSKKYKHKTGTLYSDIYSISERIGDYIINVSEAIREFQETK